MRRWTGTFGIVSDVLLVMAFPLYLVRGTPPALEDTASFTDYVTRNNSIFLTGILVDTLYIAGFLIFLSGFCHLIRRAQSDYAWASPLTFGVGLVMATITLVGDTLTGGAALDTFSKADPAVVRALTEATLPTFGAIGLIMTALFLASAGYAILATEVLPKWTGWVAYAAAILNLASAPSIYGGNNFMEATIAGGTATSGLYSYSTSIAELAFLIWLFTAAISMVIVVKREAIAPTPDYQE